MLYIFPPGMAMEREKNLQVSYLKPQNDLATERTERVSLHSCVPALTPFLLLNTLDAMTFAKGGKIICFLKDGGKGELFSLAEIFSPFNPFQIQRIFKGAGVPVLPLQELGWVEKAEQPEAYKGQSRILQSPSCCRAPKRTSSIFPVFWEQISISDKYFLTLISLSLLFVYERNSSYGNNFSKGNKRTLAPTSHIWGIHCWGRRWRAAAPRSPPHWILWRWAPRFAAAWPGRSYSVPRGHMHLWLACWLCFFFFFSSIFYFLWENMYQFLKVTKGVRA